MKKKLSNINRNATCIDLLPILFGQGQRVIDHKPDQFLRGDLPLEQGAIYHDNNHTVIAVSDYTFEDRYQGKDGSKQI